MEFGLRLQGTVFVSQKTEATGDQLFAVLPYSLTRNVTYMQ